MLDVFYLGIVNPLKSFRNLVKSNQIWIVITLSPIDLAPKSIHFGAKSIGESNSNPNLFCLQWNTIYHKVLVPVFCRPFVFWIYIGGCTIYHIYRVSEYWTPRCGQCDKAAKNKEVFSGLYKGLIVHICLWIQLRCVADSIVWLVRALGIAFQ